MDRWFFGRSVNYALVLLLLALLAYSTIGLTISVPPAEAALVPEMREVAVVQLAEPQAIFASLDVPRLSP